MMLTFFFQPHHHVITSIVFGLCCWAAYAIATDIPCGPSDGGAITIDGSSLGVPIATAWAEHYQQACAGNTTNITVTTSNSIIGAQRVCGVGSSVADIGILSRPLAATEGTTTDGYHFQCTAPSTRTVVQLQVAIDAVVLVVAPNGSAAFCLQQLFNNGLTLEQLRLLYSSYTIPQLYSIPTTAPTETPTTLPTAPTAAPSVPPTKVPTTPPTLVPTFPPPVMPTATPVRPPTTRPSPPSKLTFKPNSKPTVKPTLPKPVAKPVTTKAPTPTKGGGMMTPTTVLTPTFPPIVPPTSAPVAQPVLPPVVLPTVPPVAPPTLRPSTYPTFRPIFVPTSRPVLPPVRPPSFAPVRRPTVLPTFPPHTLVTLTFGSLILYKTRGDGGDASVCDNLEALVTGPPITSETFQRFAQTVLTDYGHGEDITPRYRAGINTDDVVSYLQTKTNAIAFLSLADFVAYGNQLQAVYVQTGDGQMLAPDPITLLAGQYPLSYNIYMDARTDDPSTLSKLQPFFEFAYSDQGDADVSTSGLVPISDAVQAQMLSRLYTTR